MKNIQTSILCLSVFIVVGLPAYQCIFGWSFPRHFHSGFTDVSCHWNLAVTDLHCRPDCHIPHSLACCHIQPFARHLPNFQHVGAFEGRELDPVPNPTACTTHGFHHLSLCPGPILHSAVLHGIPLQAMEGNCQQSYVSLEMAWHCTQNT